MLMMDGVDQATGRDKCMVSFSSSARFIHAKFWRGYKEIRVRNNNALAARRFVPTNNFVRRSRRKESTDRHIHLHSAMVNERQQQQHTHALPAQEQISREQHAVTTYMRVPLVCCCCCCWMEMTDRVMFFLWIDPKKIRVFFDISLFWTQMVKFKNNVCFLARNGFNWTFPNDNS
jgi:hypothetical protein